MAKKYSRKIKLINYWPPFLFSGIKMYYASPNLKKVKVRLRQTWYNRNLVGVHFGGSIFSMTDPFYMSMLLANLNREESKYIVWDKAAVIKFKKPGKGTISADFEITDELLLFIEKEVAILGKKDFFFKTLVKDETGAVIAEVDKTVSVRLKNFQVK
jgi:hypothetical protein